MSVTTTTTATATWKGFMRRMRDDQVGLEAPRTVAQECLDFQLRLTTTTTARSHASYSHLDPELIRNRVVCYLCEYGTADDLMAMHDTYKLNADDARSICDVDCKAMTVAAKRGDPQILHVLRTVYGLDASDLDLWIVCYTVRSRSVESLRELARFLSDMPLEERMNKIMSSSKDSDMTIGYIVSSAVFVKHGDELLRVLHDDFGVGRDHVLQCTLFALDHLLAGGASSEMRTVIRDMYQITDHDLVTALETARRPSAFSPSL